MIVDGLLSGVEIKPGTPLDDIVSLFILDRQYSNIYATLITSPHCTKKMYNSLVVKYIEASGPFEKTRPPSDRSLETLRKLQKRMGKQK